MDSAEATFGGAAYGEVPYAGEDLAQVGIPDRSPKVVFAVSEPEVTQETSDSQSISPALIPPLGTTASPDDFEDLVGWYVADDVEGSDGDPVDTWANAVPGTPDFAQTSTARPVIKRGVFGGHDALRFDGTNDRMSAGVASDWTFLHDMTGATIFIAWRINNGPEPNTFQSILSSGAFSASGIGFNMAYDDRSSVGLDDVIRVQIGRGSGSDSVANLTPFNGSNPSGEVFVTSVVCDDSGTSMRSNGSTAGGLDSGLGANPSTGSPNGALVLGAHYNSGAGTFLNGDVAEIVVFDRAITDEERLQINHYFSVKYEIDARVLENESLVFDDSGHNAFPAFVVCDNGDYLAVYRDGSGHSSADGVLMAIRSTDGGASWGTPAVTVSGGGYDYRDPSLFKSSDGTLFLSVGRRGSDTSESTDGAGLLVSTDHGANWSSVETLPTDFTDWVRGGSPVQELANGDLIVLNYGEDVGETVASVELLRSTDGGETWIAEGRIADGDADGRAYNESHAYQLSDGTIVALIRQASAAMWKTESSDNGSTWSAPELVLDGAWSWPKVAVDAEDHAYVFLRDDNSDSSWAYAPDGKSWRWGQAGLRSGGFEHGYAQSVVVDNKVLTFYAYEQNGSNSDLYLLVEDVPPGSGLQVFDPSVVAADAEDTISPELIESGTQVFEPTVATGEVSIQPDFISATSTIFEPKINLHVRSALIASTTQVLSPEMVTGKLVIEPSFISSTSQTFAPTCIPGEITVKPNLVSAGGGVLAPQVIPGPVSVSPSLIDSALQVFSPELIRIVYIQVDQVVDVIAPVQSIGVVSPVQTILVESLEQIADVDETLAVREQ